jgi:hypothetical protein
VGQQAGEHGRGSGQKPSPPNALASHHAGEIIEASWIHFDL